MFDFLKMKVDNRDNKALTIVSPEFLACKSSDLMIRGRDFYAIWDERTGMWSTDENDAIQQIDSELMKYTEEHRESMNRNVVVRCLKNTSNGAIDEWHKYVQRQMRDNYIQLDQKLTFRNTETKKEDYVSKKLGYDLAEGDISAYEEMMSTLFNPPERQKLEWAVGAIISGDTAEKIQKFVVLYGPPGSGKGTFLKFVVQELFKGYYTTFEAKELAGRNNQFGLEQFRSNPLVAIQADGDLSNVADNTKLNSLVSHERMTVNEKYKPKYEMVFRAFLFMGTNEPVDITGSKSGLNRRLIDVYPSGKKLNYNDYERVREQIKFEHGAIAWHCLQVYKKLGRHYYDTYEPKRMKEETDAFYDFIRDYYFDYIVDTNEVTLAKVWLDYKKYCEETNARRTFGYQRVRAELKDYFRNYSERGVTKAGERVRNLYSGFKKEKIAAVVLPGKGEKKSEEPPKYWLDFKEQDSLLDDILADYPAQLANKDGLPPKKWDQVKTKLKDIDTHKLHYVLTPVVHIVIDFDKKDESGNKNLELNLKAANMWPRTYAELSKSGAGIHLHYIYKGDPTKLNRIFEEGVEIKVFTGKSSLRRMLTKCTNDPIAEINGGLPLRKEVKKVLDWDGVKNEKMLRTMIIKNLRKEYHGATKPSVDYIYTLLEDANKRGVPYDVSDLYQALYTFCSRSTHQSEYCLDLLDKMKLKSDVEPEAKEEKKNMELPIIFYDVEVFPNLFLVNWKKQGTGQVVRMINPTPKEIRDLVRVGRLVGFNNRRYDNHMLYARMMGYTNEQLYDVSRKIIGKEKNAFFGQAYNMSYTDIYDFSSKKQSLKKFEIELGIHHQELGLPWDEPVPEEMWNKVAEYCDNDVIATEAVFNARHADFIAREILADVAGMTVNDTTNSLTTRIIFGENRSPQSDFNYRDMGDITQIVEPAVFDDLDGFINQCDPTYTKFDSLGRPIFPGYKYSFGKSEYRDEVPGEGGYVYSEPGMYTHIALLDIASMHPSSIVAEKLFGEEYTKRFQEILQARIAIKHKDFDKARTLLGGKLAKYLDDESAAKDLAQALKIAINSVYGLTSASFDNPFRDPRNKDNIVAKRGALFMINLKHEVQRRGFTVAHIKTDSIKIPNATPEIIDFVMKYGKLYGYNFEHEATYEKMCLVNDAVYIAKYEDEKGEWTATGTQFQVPYVFKTLFSKEPIEFDDLCETKSVSTELYLDMNENLPEGEHDYKFVGRVGRFCPIKPGCGGGELLRHKEGKYSAAGGTKGFRWLESEMVKTLGKEADIDRSYYDRLASAAVDAISSYGDYDWFVSNDILSNAMNAPETELPWD